MTKRIALIIFCMITLTSQGYGKPAPYPFECPVMPGEKVKEKFSLEYKGRVIHFCCRNCVKAFKKNPQKYENKLP